MSYYNKYIKYKYKYIQLINQQYGGTNITFSIHEKNLLNIDKPSFVAELNAEIQRNTSIPNYTIKIGYKLDDTYEHHTPEEFRAILNRIGQNIDRTQYIYIIKNYNNVMSEINENNLDTLIRHVPYITRDIIFSKLIVPIYPLYINKIYGDYMILKNLNRLVFTENEYMTLYKLAIKLNYENLEHVNNIIHHLSQPSKLNINEYAMSININSIKYIKFQSTFPTEYLAMVRTVMELNGILLEFVKNDLKNDKAVVTLAVQQNGLAYYFASDELKKDPDIIYFTVSQNGMILENIDESLHTLNISLAAVKNNGLALQFVVDDLKNNKDVVTFAVKQNGLAYHFASDTLKEDPGIIYFAVSQNGMILENINQSLHTLNISLAAVKNNGLALQFVDNQFRIKDVIIEAVLQNYMAIQIVKSGVIDGVLPLISQEDITEIYKLSIKHNPNCIQYLDNNILQQVLRICDKLEDRDIILNIFKSDNSILETYRRFPVVFDSDIEFAKKAIQQNIKCYKFCSSQVKNNIDVITILLNIDITYYIFIPEVMKTNQTVIDIIININKNKINKDSKMVLLHIGYLELDIRDTNSYTDYKFIKVSKTDDINNVITAIRQFKIESRKSTNNTYYILISLDSISYLQYLYNENLNGPFKLPNTLYNPSKYKKEKYMFGNPFTSTRIITQSLFKNLQTYDIYKNSEIDSDFNTKINDLYTKIISELNINNTNKNYNIHIINISDGNDLSSIDYITKIVNILINKYHTNDGRMFEKYSKDLYKYINLTLEKEQIYNNLLLSHWLNNLFLTPKILNKRQIQNSGTCMTNAIFNSLLLVEDIKKVLERKYNNFIKTNTPMTLAELLDKTIDKTPLVVLYSIIGNILKDIKAKRDENYMLTLSVYIQNNNNIYDEYYENTLKSMKLLLNSDKYTEIMDGNFFKMCRAANDNLYRQKICENSNSEDVIRLNNICNYTDDKSICDTYDIGSEEETGYVFGEGGDDTLIFSFIQLLFHQTLETMVKFYERYISKQNRYEELIIDDSDISILLILVNRISESVPAENLKAIEERNSKRYNLQSCMLGNIDHAICGIKNNKNNNDDPYYIYDSNNIYTTDDWSKLLENNTDEISLPQHYKEKLKTMPPFEETLFSVDYFIYTCKNE